MDLIKRKELKHFATWLLNRDLLTDKLQLIPYELAELYLESEFYQQMCESQKLTSEPDKALGLFGVMPSAYLVEISKEPHVIIADNISDACDKIEKFVSGKYEFVYSKSLPVLH